MRTENELLNPYSMEAFRDQAERERIEATYASANEAMRKAREQRAAAVSSHDEGSSGGGGGLIAGFFKLVFGLAFWGAVILFIIAALSGE